MPLGHTALRPTRLRPPSRPPGATPIRASRSPPRSASAAAPATPTRILSPTLMPVGVVDGLETVGVHDHMVRPGWRRSPVRGRGRAPGGWTARQRIGVGLHLEFLVAIALPSASSTTLAMARHWATISSGKGVCGAIDDAVHLPFTATGMKRGMLMAIVGDRASVEPIAARTPAAPPAACPTPRPRRRRGRPAADTLVGNVPRSSKHDLLHDDPIAHPHVRGAGAGAPTSSAITCVSPRRCHLLGTRATTSTTGLRRSSNGPGGRGHRRLGPCSRGCCASGGSSR